MVFIAGNVSSRFAQIEALVDYHQTHIDMSKYKWTIDRVTYNGKDFCNKPPSLSFVGSGLYFVLKKVFSLTFRQNESPTIYLLTLLIIGHPLPPKLVQGAIDQSSQFNAVIKSVPLPKNWLYPFQCLFGWHGFFTVSPVLIFGAIGLILAIKKSEPLRPRNTIVVGIALLVMLAGYALFVGSLGGWSYGIRYLIPVIPIFLFFIPVVLKRIKKAIFVCVLVVSTVFALIGMYNPWPPVDEQEIEPHPVASLVKNPTGGNFSAWAREYLGNTTFKKLIASRVIDPNEERQNQYFFLSYKSKGNEEMVQKIGVASATCTTKKD